MNKKFSTLFTAGLLIGGTLFSSAFAQTTLPAKLSNGLKVYMACTIPTGQPNAGTPNAGTPYLATSAEATATDDATVKYFTFNATTTGVNSAELFEISNYSVSEGIATFTLKNKDGKTIQVAKDGTISTTGINKADLTQTFELALGAENAYVFSEGIGLRHGSLTNERLAVASGTTPVFDTSNWSVAFFIADETEASAADINALASNGSFSLKYKDATSTPFGGSLKVFEYAGDMYIASAWPKSLNNASTITTVSDFQKCTFIALNATKSWKIHELAKAGEGLKFTTVSGKNLLTAVPDASQVTAGKVYINNAQFTAVEIDPVNAENKFTLRVSGIQYMKSDGTLAISGDLTIAIVPDQGAKIVTTVATSDEADYTNVCTVESSNLQNVSELLSTTGAATVYNIQFLSKEHWNTSATWSEYNKYLGIDGVDLLAQGVQFVNLDAPENQWIVTGADLNANTITLTNREDNEIFFTVQLKKTSAVGVYEVVQTAIAQKPTNDPLVPEEDVELSIAYVGGDGQYYRWTSSNGIGGTLMKLIPATVTPTAGFATTELDNVGLVRFNFTNEDMVVANDLYVTVDDDDVNLIQDERFAAKWSVVKFDASASELGTLSSDTLYAYNDYVYYDAANKEVKQVLAGDKMAAVTYTFKYYADDSKEYLSQTVSWGGSNIFAIESNVEDANDVSVRFLVKVNKNGSYSLIPVDPTETDLRDALVDGSTYTADVMNAVVVLGKSIYYDFGEDYTFTIKAEELTPSLAHKPGYVLLESSNGGYIAMDTTNNEGFVAPVSSLRSYSEEQLTIKLDTADTDALVPSFFLSIAGNYMYNAADSASYYNSLTASQEINENYYLPTTNNAKAIFRSATLLSADTMAINVAGKDTIVTPAESDKTMAGLNNFKYQIVQQTATSEGEYVIKSVGENTYLYSLNGRLGFTTDPERAIVVSVTEGSAPTANETVAASEVSVVAVNGAIIVKGAAGKVVTVANILGQTIANQVAASDNVTIAAPAGIAVVTVDGEATKVVVK